MPPTPTPPPMTSTPTGEQQKPSSEEVKHASTSRSTTPSAEGGIGGKSDGSESTATATGAGSASDSPSSSSSLSAALSSGAPAPSSVSTTTVTPAASTTASTPVLPPSSLVPAGGESIYRTIMNRLTALEAAARNHTQHVLYVEEYARYVEEHTGAVREVLRRVGEDLGRAEGAGKAQAQTYARTLLEWERQRKRGDAEYRALVQRVEYLADEIVLEKRLGIAQLLLLLAVLVFMTLTRGSRGEAAVVMPSASMMSRAALRAWGRRNLSLRSLGGSGDWDWVGRLKSQSRSRSQSPKPAKERERGKGKEKDDPPIKLEFPTVDEKPKHSPGIGVGLPPSSASKPKPARLTLHTHGRPRSRTRSIGNGNTVLLYDSPRVRTPTRARTPHRRPATPTHPYATPNYALAHAHGQTPSSLPMQHSVSQGQGAPRSARRWARTAHLHELRGGASVQRVRGVGARDAGAEARSVVNLASPEPGAPDVFASPSPASAGPMNGDMLGMGVAMRRRVASGSGGGGSVSAGGSGALLFRGLSPSPAGSVCDLEFGEAQLASADDAGEGDSWVDTDEGSEMGAEGDADVGMESPWAERVEQVAVGA
ncbi:hypothetical protein B0H11DRAFT_1976462 [Mycena galericulata]|nr:hypothetical protein B0H11DRAFT_1976462 [Mycena galericulata]